MKKNLLRTLPVAIALFMFSCGETKHDETPAENAEHPEMHDKMDHADDADHSSKMMEVSPEMTDFMMSWDGTFEKVEGSLKKHGATPEIMEHEMGMYDLKDPEVMSHEGDCYMIKCKSGMVENKYAICWKDGKIISIEEKM